MLVVRCALDVDKNSLAASASLYVLVHIRSDTDTDKSK